MISISPTDLPQFLWPLHGAALVTNIIALVIRFVNWCLVYVKTMTSC